ncbi:hypothetical protein [Halobacteriovorax sp.]|uniref:hypothetical protein n=1 Tax=Halobacteriovorax sp. TaxID=2020862 RepID=UPI00356832FB
MNLRKALIIGSLLVTGSSIVAGEMSPEEFLSCYKKAIHERIEEIKEQDPEAELCDKLSDVEERLLHDLYLGEVLENGVYTKLGSAAISNSSLQSHYEYIRNEKQRYDISCYDSRFHLLKRTDLDLIEEGLEKMFNVKLGFRGWHEKVKDLDHSFCK